MSARRQRLEPSAALEVAGDDRRDVSGELPPNGTTAMGSAPSAPSVISMVSPAAAVRCQPQSTSRRRTLFIQLTPYQD